MALVPISDATGQILSWINPDHIVSVRPIFRTATHGVDLEVELKLDGMPLERLQLGNFPDRESVQAAAAEFVDKLS